MNKNRREFLQQFEAKPEEARSPQAVADALGHRCTICGKQSVATGVFFPKPEWLKRFGLQEGKVIGYLVCREHYGGEHVKSVEAVLEEKLSQGLN